MRTAAAILCCLPLIASGERAHADGGRLVAMEQQGPYRIAIFVAPDPPRVGTIDVSVLLQAAANGAAIADAEVRVTLTPPDGAALHTAATTAAATNKLLRAALIEVPYAGRWQGEVNGIGTHGDATVRFEINVSPPLPPWLTVWPWFTWPLGAAAIFAVHRRLVAKRAFKFAVQ